MRPGRMVIRGGRVIDPAMGRDDIADVLLVDGEVAELGSDLDVDGAEIVDGECGVQASSTQIQIRFLEREDLAQVGSFGHLPVDGHVTFSILWADLLPTTPPEVSAATRRVRRRHPRRGPK